MKPIQVKMSKFDEISAARKILELPERSTLPEIKSNYRRLLAKWHPDKTECLSDETVSIDDTAHTPHGCITSLLITIQDFLVSGVS